MSFVLGFALGVLFGILWIFSVFTLSSLHGLLYVCNIHVR